METPSVTGRELRVSTVRVQIDRKLSHRWAWRVNRPKTGHERSLRQRDWSCGTFH